MHLPDGKILLRLFLRYQDIYLMLVVRWNKLTSIITSIIWLNQPRDMSMICSLFGKWIRVQGIMNRNIYLQNLSE